MKSVDQSFKLGVLGALTFPFAYILAKTKVNYLCISKNCNSKVSIALVLQINRALIHYGKKTAS